MECCLRLLTRSIKIKIGKVFYPDISLTINGTKEKFSISLFSSPPHRVGGKQDIANFYFGPVDSEGYIGVDLLPILILMDLVKSRRQHSMGLLRKLWWSISEATDTLV